MYGLEDRLLDQYERLAWPFFSLASVMQWKTEKVEALEEKMKKQGEALDYLQIENLELKQRLKRIEETRRGSYNRARDFLISYLSFFKPFSF